MKVSWAMSGTRSTSRTIRPTSLSIRRWYLTTSISKALTSPCLTRSTRGASASGAFIQGGDAFAATGPAAASGGEYTAQRKACHSCSRPRRCDRQPAPAAARPAPAQSQEQERAEVEGDGDARRLRSADAASGQARTSSGPSQHASTPASTRPSESATRPQPMPSADGRGQRDRASAPPAPRPARRRPGDERGERGQRDAATAAAPDAESAQRHDAGRAPAHGTARRRAGAIGQTRLKTSVPLVPPKPKLFFTA